MGLNLLGTVRAKPVVGAAVAQRQGAVANGVTVADGGAGPDFGKVECRGGSVTAWWCCTVFLLLPAMKKVAGGGATVRPFMMAGWWNACCLS